MLQVLLAADQATGGNIAGGVTAALGKLLNPGAKRDAERFAKVKSYAQMAANGDVAKLRQLEFFAFEKSEGLPGDERKRDNPPVMSPPGIRNPAREALAILAQNGAQLSKPEYYAKLALPTPPTLLQRVATVAAEAARPVIAGEVRAAAAAGTRRALPYVIGALLLGALLAVVFRLRR